jgi:hypothetical protein
VGRLLGGRRTLVLMVLALFVVALLVWLFAFRPPAQPLVGQGPGKDCGKAVNVGNQYDGRPPSCLWSVFSSGSTGHAVMTNYTVEGDPVTFGVAISAKDKISISIVSHDRFGAQGGFAYACSGLTRQLVSGSPGRFYLVATGCTGPLGFLDDSGRVTIA